MCQLVLTGGFIAVFTFSDPVRVWTRQNPWLYIVALVVLIVSRVQYLFLIKNESLLRAESGNCCSVLIRLGYQRLKRCLQEQSF
jgi:hypothetical protein